MKSILIALALLLGTTSAYAQTVSQSLAWDHLADTLANVQTYTFDLKIDAATAVPAIATCVAAGANVHCTTPLALTSGTHTLILTAVNATAVTPSDPFTYTPGANPTKPVNLTIIVKITVP